MPAVLGHISGILKIDFLSIIINKKVPNAKCILHVHSKYALALSCLKDPTLPPIDQNTMRFYNRVAVYKEFGGLGFEEESEKMATD